MKKEIIFEDPGISENDFFLLEGENNRQIHKWGLQRVTPFEWLAYLTEEVGELAEAIIDFTYERGQKKNISKEAVQVATLALKISKMAEGVRE